MTEQTVAAIAAIGRSLDYARDARREANRRLATVRAVAEAVWFCISHAAINGHGNAANGQGDQS
jgi:hypothetical protein